MNAFATINAENAYAPTENDSESVRKVHALLHPTNIAIVGASSKPGNYAERIYYNLQKYGFQGPIFPINPGRSEVWGTTCYPSMAATPEKPDHALVLVQAPMVPTAIREAAAAGARSATIVTSGFEEVEGEEGKALARELAAAIRDTGIAVSGPNCLGNLNTGHNMYTNIDSRPTRMEPGHVAVVGQSGGIAMIFRETLEERGIDLRFMVTAGNEAGLSMADYIEYFAWHPDVKVIVAYGEGVRHSDRFLAACRKAKEARKPIIFVKAGTSEAGRSAAMAHTGALAGSTEVFDAVTSELGVVRVESIDNAIELTDVFLFAQPPRGGRVAAITPSGGKRALLIDAAEREGVSLTELSPETSARLAELLGPGSIVGNPLDAGFAATKNPQVFSQCSEILFNDPDVDILILEGELPVHEKDRGGQGMAYFDQLARDHGKTIIFYKVSSYAVTPYGAEFKRQLRVPVVQGVVEVSRAIRALVDYYTRKLPVEAPQGSTPQAKAMLERILQDHVGGALDEVTSKALLTAYGVPVSREIVAGNADEAVVAAREFGFPVVAKVVSKDILHKSDIGGVILNLTTEEAVRGAFELIMKRARALPSNPTIDGVLIAQQAQGDVELVVGGVLDPEIGPAVMFGTGGVEIELAKDVVFHRVPLSRQEAEGMIARTKAGVRMAGYRGKSRLSHEEAISTIVGVGQLLADAAGRIASIDVNPILVNRDGGLAVDGLIVLSDTRA